MSEAGSAAEVQAEEVELLDEYSLPDEARSAAVCRHWRDLQADRTLWSSCVVREQPEPPSKPTTDRSSDGGGGGGGGGGSGSGAHARGPEDDTAAVVAAVRRATPAGLRLLDVTDAAVSPPALLPLLLAPASPAPQCSPNGDRTPDGGAASATAGAGGQQEPLALGGVSADTPRTPKRTPSVGPIESVSQNRLRVSGTGGGGGETAEGRQGEHSGTNAGGGGAGGCGGGCGVETLLGACGEPWQAEDAAAVLAGCPRLQLFEADVVAYSPALPLLPLLAAAAFRPRAVILCDDPHSRRPLGAGVVEAVCARIAADSGGGDGGGGGGAGGGGAPPPCIQSLTIQMAVPHPDAAALAAALPLSRTLTSLRLCMRRADPAAVSALLAAAARCAPLTAVDVSSTRLSGAAVASLASAAAAGGLRELTVSACDASSGEGGGGGGGSGGALDFAPVAVALRDPRCRLRTLALADINELAEGFSEALGESLRVNASLETLGLGFCNLSDDDVAAVCAPWLLAASSAAAAAAETETAGISAAAETLIAAAGNETPAAAASAAGARAPPTKGASAGGGSRAPGRALPRKAGSTRTINGGTALPPAALLDAGGGDDGGGNQAEKSADSPQLPPQPQPLRAASSLGKISSFFSGLLSPGRGGDAGGGGPSPQLSPEPEAAQPPASRAPGITHSPAAAAAGGATHATQHATQHATHRVPSVTRIDLQGATLGPLAVSALRAVAREGNVRELDLGLCAVEPEVARAEWEALCGAIRGSRTLRGVTIHSSGLPGPIML